MPETPGLAHPAVVYRPWLHAWAVLLVVATFALITIGGNVTSLGVGMAVPDGWWTFEYFTPFAPLSSWWHDMGTRWEHSHRLKGYVVGTITIVLAVWLWRSQKPRPWLRWLGVGLLGLVIVQGVMGALRVDRMSLNFAVLHGITGQIFLALTVLAAAATSRMWVDATNRPAVAPADSVVPRGLLVAAWSLLAVLLVQLALGAWIRHHGAGLAIPDFPMAYGELLPPTRQVELDLIAAAMGAPSAPSLTKVWMHFSHRLGAAVVLGVALLTVLWLNVRAPRRRLTTWPARWLMLLLGVQIALGAMVIWTQRTPEVATAHQAVGASLLAVAAWLTMRLHLLRRIGDEPGTGVVVNESTDRELDAELGGHVKGQMA